MKEQGLLSKTNVLAGTRTKPRLPNKRSTRQACRSAAKVPGYI